MYRIQTFILATLVGSCICPHISNWISYDIKDNPIATFKEVENQISSNRQYIKSMNAHLGDIKGLQQEEILKRIKSWPESIPPNVKVSLRILKKQRAASKIGELLYGDSCSTSSDKSAFEQLREMAGSVRSTWDDLGPFEETLIKAMEFFVLITCRTKSATKIKELEGTLSREFSNTIRTIATSAWLSEKPSQVWQSQMMFNFKPKAVNFPRELYDYIVAQAEESELQCFNDPEQLYIPEDVLVEMYHRELVEPCTRYVDIFQNLMDELKVAESPLKPKLYEPELATSVRQFVVCKGIVKVSRESCFSSFTDMVERVTRKPIRRDFLRMLAFQTQAFFTKKLNSRKPENN